MEIGIALGINKDTNETRLSPYSASGWAFGTGDGIYVTVKLVRGNWQASLVPVPNVDTKGTVVSIEPGSMQLVNGYPYSFNLVVTTGNRTETIPLFETDRFDASALKRGQKYYLIGGHRPTYLVGLLGPVASGKTCFSRAIRCQAAVRRLNSLFHEQFDCCPTKDVDLRPDRSPLYTFEGTPIHISSQRGDELGDVILVDMAGELTRDSVFNQALFSSEEYSLADRRIANRIFLNARRMDALLLFTRGQSLFTQHEDVKGDYAPFLRRLNRKVLCAVAITEADEICSRLTAAEKAASEPEETNPTCLVDQEAQKKALVKGELSGNAVLCSTSKLFQQATNEDEIYEHVAMARDLYADAFRNVDCPVFLLSSLQKNGEEFDFSKSRNVEIPLAWLLSRMMPMHFKEVGV